MEKKFIVSVGSSYICELIITEEIANVMHIEDLKEWIVFEASALFIDGDFNEYNN